MLTDRFTAQVLGGLMVAMTVLIDVCMFVFNKPEVTHKPGFPLVVIIPSLPLFAIAGYLFHRAKSLKDPD